MARLGFTGKDNSQWIGGPHGVYKPLWFGSQATCESVPFWDDEVGMLRWGPCWKNHRNARHFFAHTKQGHPKIGEDRKTRRSPKGWFPKGWSWRMFTQNENRNEGTFGCSPRTKNRNEGTFACSHGTKSGTRVHSPKPPFYQTALLSPCERQGFFSDKKPINTSTLRLSSWSQLPRRSSSLVGWNFRWGFKAQGRHSGSLALPD